MRAKVVLIGVLAASSVACSPEPADDIAGGDWVGVVTTEGDVTTVVNESGSVWGGTATLVEELSIGVESGADEFMFGAIGAVFATDDRIYVADVQAPAVRAYDHDGAFIGDIGREGEGPGEYSYPAPMTAYGSGRLFVLDSRHGRVNVYNAAREPLETWPLTVSRCCAWPMFALGPQELWVPVRERIEDPADPRDYRVGIQSVGPQGPQGAVTWIPDFELEQPTYELHGHPVPTPFAPQVAWNAAPERAVLYGAPDRYRFEVLRADGTRLVIERYWEPVPVSAEEKEWERQSVVAMEREFNEPSFSWDGATIPDHKPAYSWLGPTLSGEVWVWRPGASEHVADCVENPIEAGYRAAMANRCWRAASIVDAFGADGRYLGEVDVPSGMTPLAGMAAVVDGRRVVARFEDDAGTIMVKRYRLVLPGERGS